MKRIAIIGASSGIGRRVALDLAAKGWRVGIAARSADKLKEVAATHPGSIIWRSIDVTRPDAGDEVRALIEAMGGIDALLLASGVGFANPDLHAEKDENIVAVNVGGFTRVISSTYKYYKECAREGQIIAITSVAGTKGMGVAAAYSASKSYQQAYLQAIDQLAHTQGVKVKVTDIRPGFIRTPLLDPQKSYPLIMAVDYAAPLVEKAIERAPRVAYIDWRWGLVTALWRLIPDSLWPHVRL